MSLTSATGPIEVSTASGKRFECYPVSVDAWRQRAADRVAASAAAELGIPTPAVRWFADEQGLDGFYYRHTPGVVYIWAKVSDLERTVRHEVAHTAGILTNEEPEAFAFGDAKPMHQALAARMVRDIDLDTRPRIRIVRGQPKVTPMERLREQTAAYDFHLDPAVRAWIAGKRPAIRSGTHAAWIATQVEKRYDYIVRTAEALGIALEEALRTIWPTARDTAEVLEYARQKGRR